MEFDAPDLHGLDYVDDATATLILQLQKRDIEELFDTNKGKSRDGEYSDADLALVIYQKELEDRNMIIADRRMSRSLTRAVISDAALLTESLAEENAAAGDRALAYRLNGNSVPSVVTEQTIASCTLADGLVARLAALYVFGGKDEDGPLESTVQDDGSASGESSAWAASRQKVSTVTRHKCTACDTARAFSDIFQAPCGHHYCQECLHTLFELSTTDETLFPPRCCRQQISLTSVKLYLNSKLIHAFEQKSIEFRTSDRTYCSQPACSSFIASDNITGERATCTVCGTSTCTICKCNSHNGDCPEDIATQQVLETAREQGWQRCYNCRRLVELDVGCNHMMYVLILIWLFKRSLT